MARASGRWGQPRCHFGVFSQDGTDFLALSMACAAKVAGGRARSCSCQAAVAFNIISIAKGPLVGFGLALQVGFGAPNTLIPGGSGARYDTSLRDNLMDLPVGSLADGCRPL